MIRLFRRAPKAKAPKSLPEAELARRLTAPGYRCACCGEVLDAPHAVRLAAPFGWPDPPAPEPDSAFDETSGDIITERYARRGRDLLARAHLPLPIQGTDEHVFLGVWAYLSTGDFARFRSAQARGDAERMGDLSSFLYSRIPATDGPLLSKGILVPVEAGGMPVYWITDPKHPLHAAQHSGGMTASAACALYEDLGKADLLACLKA